MEKNKKIFETLYNNKKYKKKTPPHSIEAEQSILGGLMLDNNKWDEVSEIIVEKDFFIIQHRIIFNEMKNLLDLEYPIDLITLSESLEQKKKLEIVGRFSYLAELSKNTLSTANIKAYANIVKERAIIREIILAANKIIIAGYNTKGRNSENLLDYAESIVFKISESRIKKKIRTKKYSSNIRFYYI